jgi:hypothetical protein
MLEKALLDAPEPEPEPEPEVYRSEPMDSSRDFSGERELRSIHGRAVLVEKSVTSLEAMLELLVCYVVKRALRDLGAFVCTEGRL